MGVNLYGLEADVLFKIASKEPIIATTKALKDAKQRLVEKGLVEVEELTEKGKKEVEWRTKIIEGVRDVYDLKPGGGYLRNIHFLYEPVNQFSYAWNWCGLHGVSTLKTDPRKGTTFFEAGGTSFWIEGKLLTQEDLNFNTPSPKIVEAWHKGNVISKSARELWDINDWYFRFFLDFKEDCYYDVLNMGVFQSWLIVDDYHFNSCFFIAVTGAFGGGKSVTCEAIIFVCRHGKVANPSIAYLGRAMERLGLSVFMDEFDVIEKTDPEMGRLARMCQRRGQTYDRATKSGTTQTFDVFGPWVMSIHGNLEDALATRTIPITTEETGDTDVPVVNPEKVRIGQEIYDQMWIWYLDNLDHVSYEMQRSRGFDFNLDTILEELVVSFTDRGEPYITTEKDFDLKSKIDDIDAQYVTDNGGIYTGKTNKENTSNKSKMGKNEIERIRRRVAESILASCTDQQKKIIRRAAGRNIELMVTAFKITNIVNVNRDESIERAFEIKRETEEEERQIGVIGHIRDLLIELYKKYRLHENYWTRDGFFMISNMELFKEVNPFLHRREQSGIVRQEYNESLRELGFIRPTSRRKMAIMTWEEIQNEEEKAKVRLANIYTDNVLRKLSLTVDKPDFGQRAIDDFKEEQPQQKIVLPTKEEIEKQSEPLSDLSLQEKMELAYGELKGAEDGVSSSEIAERLGIGIGEADKLIAKLVREGRAFAPRIGYWMAVR